MLILKYGGSSLATPEHIQRRAQQIKSFKSSGQPVIVVVSAMGKTTDELIKLAYTISPTPKRRELDMLLSTGERNSMALLSMALNDIGVPAISFTGSQAGVMTELVHNQAKIKCIKPIRVDEELKKDKVVIIAGFQGVNPESKEITTLGRGGSDSTAISLAQHYAPAECVILKDVPGVLSGNPNWIEEPLPIPNLTQQQAFEMCLWGAQVIHAQAVETAKDNNIEFSIALADDPNQKTNVTSDELSDSPLKALSVNGHEHVACIQLDTTNWRDDWFAFLTKNDIVHPEVLYAHEKEVGKIDLWIKVNIQSFSHLKDCLKAAEGLFSGLSEGSSISISFNQPLTEPVNGQISSFEKLSETCYSLRNRYTSTIVVEHNKFKNCLIEWHKLTKQDQL